MGKRRYRRKGVCSTRNIGPLQSGRWILDTTGWILLRILFPVIGIVARKTLQIVSNRKLSRKNQVTRIINHPTEKEISYSEPREISSDLDYKVVNGEQEKR